MIIASCLHQRFKAINKMLEKLQKQILHFKLKNQVQKMDLVLRHYY